MSAAAINIQLASLYLRMSMLDAELHMRLADAQTFAAMEASPAPQVKLCKFPVGDKECGAEVMHDPRAYANVCEYHVFWASKDGECIPIVEMETRHLKNTINMLLRQATAEYHLKHVAPIQMQALINEARRRDLWGDPEDLRERLFGEKVHDPEKPPLKRVYAGAYWSPSIKKNAIRRKEMEAAAAALEASLAASIQAATK